MTLTVSEKQKTKPTKLQPKVVKQATVDFERDDYEDDEFDSFSMSKSAASTKLNQHKRYSSNLSQDEITCFQCFAKFPADQAGAHRLKCLKQAQARIEEREDDSDEKYTSVEKSIEKSDTHNKVGKVKLEVKENIGGKPAKKANESEDSDGTAKNDDDSDDVSDSYTVSLSQSQSVTDEKTRDLWNKLKQKYISSKVESDSDEVSISK